MSASKANQTGTATVVKLDSGYKGLVVKTSSRGLWFEGQTIYSQKLIDFPELSLLNVVILFTEKEEVVVQKVTVKAFTSEDYVLSDYPSVSEYPPLWAVDMEELESITASGNRETEGTTPVADRKLKESEPATLSDYYISPETRLIYNTALGISRAKPETSVKIMMVGESGYGKTWTPKFFAERAGLNHIYMDCAKIRDPEEWFGYREARGGDTVFIRSQFAKVIEEGNCVVVLDEFNRLEPWLHNTLYPLLDERGETTVHDEVFRVGPGTIIVGTINTGYRYTGVFELDEALLNRFEFVVEVGPMPHENEVQVLVARNPGLKLDDAEKIVKAANTLRQQNVVCSTRTTLRIASMVVGGMSPRQSFESAVIRRIPQDGSGTTLRKQVIDSVNAQLGRFVANLTGEDVFGSSGNSRSVPEAAESRFLLILSKSERRPVLQVQALKCLCSLSLPDGSNYSLAQAKTVLGKIESGFMEIMVSEQPDRELVDAFASCGIVVRFGKA